jgi:methylenetetrahydrofolate reductase (NADPH)
MQIKDFYKRGKTVVSFEIFPPKMGSGTIESITDKLAGFSKLNPDFISVTYGAGGTTTGITCDIAGKVKNDFKIESLAHVTCLSSTKDVVINTMDRLKENGVSNILALRGDFPTGDQSMIPNPIHFEYASDLISFIKNHYGDTFCIGAACYPEGHIESRSLTQDLLNLKTKVDTGVDFLVSQLFYDNEQYYRFLDSAAKAGIKVPISAGIMPVINAKQIHNIVTLCGATLPRKFIRILDKYEDNPQALMEAGIMYALDQIIDLVTNDVEGIHLYTMNRPEVATKIVNNISHILKRG